MTSTYPHLLATSLVVLAFAFGAAATACEADGGVECADAKAAAEEKTGYTWDELVAAIPQLEKFELSFSPSTREGAADGEGTYLVCQRVRSAESRIKRRSCMPLVEYLAFITDSGNLTNDQRYLALDILSRQTIAPINSFSLGTGSLNNN
ncbi:MAG: hypothetical protein AAF184_15260 [Pseudomonadota bacterium]